MGSYIFGLWFIILTMLSLRAGCNFTAVVFAVVAVVTLASNLRRLL